jgi:hypothetical protein
MIIVIYATDIPTLCCVWRANRELFEKLAGEEHPKVEL